VIAYANRALPAPLFAAGYSFGCWTVVSGLGQFALRGVILISPTIGRHDFGNLKPGAPQTCVISSDNDFLTAENVMRAWVARHPAVRRHHCLPASEHFFRGQERLVAAHCVDFIKELPA
jgi:alpha/beta superfamily hydrolase